MTAPETFIIETLLVTGSNVREIPGHAAILGVGKRAIVDPTRLDAICRVALPPI